GEAKYPIMGCYGIGVGRLAASICQESCDNYGPIWPISVAPWEVEICNLRNDDEKVRTTAQKLYDDLTKAGVEVLYDDREVRPGSMFADADLLGVPVRVVVSPKTCDRDVVEVSLRDKSLKTEFDIETACEDIAMLVAELKARLREV
ncbi:MAG: proline--tRNA ligase, partial [Clostridia bacterium]|nr:proline--tRNA ligase [Clostridia bacterium]